LDIAFLSASASLANTGIMGKTFKIVWVGG